MKKWLKTTKNNNGDFNNPFNRKKIYGVQYLTKEEIKELETKEDGRMVNLNLLNENDEDNNVKANLKKDPSAKKKAKKSPKKKKKSPKKNLNKEEIRQLRISKFEKKKSPEKAAKKKKKQCAFQRIKELEHK